VVERYIVARIAATRRPERFSKDLQRWIHVGASPRGTLALDKSSRARAWLNDRDYVTSDDVRAIVHDCLRHPCPPSHPGVYADLSELVRLKFRTRGFSFLPRQPVQSILAGRHASRLRGRGLNFEEIRRYLPGDDIRNMDWRVTARMRTPHVRVYTEERDRPVLLVVDQRQSRFFGSRRAMKSVVAAEATALAAWRVLQAGDRVSGLVFDD
jgi:hypothetical protein